MSYYLQIGTDQQPLASVTGWKDARGWIESLPPQNSKCLRHFAKFGWEQDLDDARDELAACLKTHPPADQSVLATIKNWLALMQERDKSATVMTLTQGMGDD